MGQILAVYQQNGDTIDLPQGSPVASVSTTAGGTFARATASGLPVLGLVQNQTIAAGASGFVQGAGILELATTSWDALTGKTGGLTPGAPYFLGSSPGTLSTIVLGQAPIGIALTSTAFLIHAGSMGASSWSSATFSLATELADVKQRVEALECVGKAFASLVRALEDERVDLPEDVLAAAELMEELDADEAT